MARISVLGGTGYAGSNIAQALLAQGHQRLHETWLEQQVAGQRRATALEAAEAAQRTLEIFPGCEPAFGEFATALTGQGNHEEAYNLMRYAASNNPGSLPIHLNLGLAAKRAGHTDEARGLARQIREALAGDPNRGQVEEILAEIEG